MSRRALAPAGALLFALALGPDAAAQASRSAVLPSATAAIRTSPPLQTSAATTTERRIPGRVTAATTVDVAVAPDGTPRRITAANRLLLVGTGDYSFVVPAPAEDVRPAPASASTPGLRSGAVLWQGFVANRRMLSALITLRPRVVAPSLTLRITLDDGRATIVNATTTSATTVTATARAAAVATALDTARSALVAHRGVPTTVLPVRGGIRTVSLRIVAPIAVSAVYRFDDGPVRRASALVASAPLRLAGEGELTRFELTARAISPAAALRPRRSGTWRAYAASGGLARDAFGTAARALLRAALAGQYEAFLANPDPVGRSSTTYRYVLAAAARPRSGGSGGHGSWLAVALAIGFAGALVAGVVAWAHS